MTDEVKPEKLEKLTQVKIISRGEKMAIVEVIEGEDVQRYSVPLSAIKDYKVSDAVLAKAVLYGLPFETLDFPKVGAKEIAKTMRRYNLWTADDLRTHPRELQSALAELTSGVLTTLVQYIKDK